MALLDHLQETSARIEKLYGIRYLARPYCPGRAETPLCLTSARYRAKHEIFRTYCGRGREMMKTTALTACPGPLFGVFPVFPGTGREAQFLDHFTRLLFFSFYSSGGNTVPARRWLYRL